MVDEYGEVQGIPTPRDLLEAITGELQPHLQNEAWGTLQKDRSRLFDGMIPVNELKTSRYRRNFLPEEEKISITLWPVYSCSYPGNSRLSDIKRLVQDGNLSLHPGWKARPTGTRI